MAPLAWYNYSVDFFGVFKEDLDDRLNEPNMRFIKTRYLIDHPSKYDTYIFGSSRTGKILANLQDSNSYNMYYSDGLPAEFLEDLQVLINHDVQIKRVFVGLDEFSFKIIPSTHQSQLLRRRYYGDLTQDAMSYFEYLIDPPKFGLKPFSVATSFDYAQTGSPLHFAVDSAIAADESAHLRSPKFDKAPFYDGKRTVATLKEIKSIKNLCADHNIELVFFFNPVYIETYAQYDFADIASIKKGLADITSFYDFSGVTSITTNRLNYYESSHYRYHVGDSIWNVISTGLMEEYVQYIDSVSIDSHLSKEQSKLSHHLLSAMAFLD